MLRTIVKDPLFLSEKAQVATKEDLWIGKDLQDTLTYHRDRCIGLAANMIGEKKAVIIISMGFVDLVMFNPQIIKQSGVYQTEESCLSLTGSKPTKRFETITVRYLDMNWREKNLTLTGLPAQICQHEMDHLEGKLI